MKNLTKSQKLNIFSSACFLFVSIVDFIQKNYTSGFCFLTLSFSSITLAFSEKNKKRKKSNINAKE